MLPKLKTITLKCCVCGKEKRGEVEEHPRFGFEVKAIAESAGWGAGVDFKHSRTLVFCSKRCENAALTKDRKSYRKYIPTLPEEDGNEAE